MGNFSAIPNSVLKPLAHLHYGTMGRQVPSSESCVSHRTSCYLQFRDCDFEPISFYLFYVSFFMVNVSDWVILQNTVEAVHFLVVGCRRQLVAE
jgi:hypothetical protein